VVALMRISSISRLQPDWLCVINPAIWLQVPSGWLLVHRFWFFKAFSQRSKLLAQLADLLESPLKLIQGIRAWIAYVLVTNFEQHLSHAPHGANEMDRIVLPCRESVTTHGCAPSARRSRQ
jgi:hypothetical protein